jgi:hypothetical protein
MLKSNVGPEPMQRYVLALVIAMTAEGICRAQSLTPADIASLKDAPRFRMMAATASIPKEVSQFCADSNGRLAGSGERWNATDVMFPGLATRRFIWLSRSEQYFVAHYEEGGLRHSAHIAVARVRSDGRGYELIWRADGPRLRDHRDLVRALEANAYRPEPLFQR